MPLSRIFREFLASFFAELLKLCRGRHAADRLGQGFGDEAHIAHEATRNRRVPANFFGVYARVDQRDVAAAHETLDALLGAGAETDAAIDVLRIVLEPAGQVSQIADVQRMKIGKITVEAAVMLDHGYRQELRQFDDGVIRAALADLETDLHQRRRRIEQKSGGTFYLGRVRLQVHRHGKGRPRVDLRCDVGLVEVVAGNPNVGRPARLDVRQRVGPADPFRYPVRLVHDPLPFRVLFHGLGPVIEIFVAVPALDRRIRMVADHYKRRAVLKCVVHIGTRMRQPDPAEHPEAGLARRFRVAVGNRQDLALVRGLYELQIGVRHDRIAQRAKAGAVGNEHVLRAGLEDLLDHQVSTGTRYGARVVGWHVGARQQRLDRCKRRLGRDRSVTRSGHAAQKAASRDLRIDKVVD